MALQVSDFDKPHNFEDCVDFLAASVSSNQTVNRLLHSVPDSALDTDLGGELAAMRANIAKVSNTQDTVKALTKLLESWNMKKFVPLSRAGTQSGVSMAFYAGDGVVAKITHMSFMPARLRPLEGSYTPMPGVIPPIATQMCGEYVVELFPWIKTNTPDSRDVVNERDLAIVKRYLKANNLKFKEQDDRLDNIGLLPNGFPAVLDTDAVEPIDPKLPVGASHTWMHKEIYANFGKLYTEYAERLPQLVSDEPDFSFKFHRAHTPKRNHQL